MVAKVKAGIDIQSWLQGLPETTVERKPPPSAPGVPVSSRKRKQADASSMESRPPRDRRPPPTASTRTPSPPAFDRSTKPPPGSFGKAPAFDRSTKPLPGSFGGRAPVADRAPVAKPASNLDRLARRETVQRAAVPPSRPAPPPPIDRPTKPAPNTWHRVSPQPVAARPVQPSPTRTRPDPSPATVVPAHRMDSASNPSSIASTSSKLSRVTSSFGDQLERLKTRNDAVAARDGLDGVVLAARGLVQAGKGVNHVLRQVEQRRGASTASADSGSLRPGSSGSSAPSLDTGATSIGSDASGGPSSGQRARIGAAFGKTRARASALVDALKPEPSRTRYER